MAFSWAEIYLLPVRSCSQDLPRPSPFAPWPLKLTLSRTVQKLAHLRQEAELSGDSDEHPTNGHDLGERSRGSSSGGKAKLVSGQPVILVPSPSPDGANDNGADQLGIIRVQSPTPTSSRTLSRQQINGDGIPEEDEDENREEEGKDRQVKEGAYLKSKLWWFGLLLIATGEGGRSEALILTTQTKSCR